MSTSFDFVPVLLQQIPYKTVRIHFDHSLVEQRKLAECISSVKTMLSGQYLELFLVEYFREATEYDDELMELSFAANSMPSQSILYFMFEHDYINIQSSNYMVSNGTTGAHIWEAGVALGEYLSHNRHIVHDKRVIELGCGTGFCGIVAGRCGAKLVTVTDLAVVLETCTKPNISNNIITMDLDWRYPESVDFSSFDVLIASDVIFDPEIVPCLVELLNCAKNAGVRVTICQKVRNLSTFDLFIEQLHIKGISPTIADAPPCSHFYYNHTDIKLITF